MLSIQMQLHLIGPHPLACDEQGRQLTRIGTLFPERGVLYTRPPGVHAWQRLSFIDFINSQRADQGLPVLTPEEEEAIAAVDLVFEPDHLLIRPDPQRLDLAFEADEMLQTLVSKRQVQFLSVSDSRIRDALKRRGEYWRLCSLPATREGKKQLVLSSKVAINGLPIYYYNRLTGTRWLTYQEFENLGHIDDASLARHLQEIAEYSSSLNRLGLPEVGFFGADLQQFGGNDFAGVIYARLSSEQLRAKFNELQSRFRSAVHGAYLRDDLLDRSWSQRALETFFLDGDEAQIEQVMAGLSPEFYMQVQWLPGGRFEGGEFILDSIFDEAAARPADPDLQRLCDTRAKEIILNFIRDHGDLEYINLGCVPESLSLVRPQKEGRRAVYLVEFFAHNAIAPVRRVCRLQKWGVWEHLDEGKDLLRSIIESDDYTEYLLDRRLGCRQLGMNLSRRVVMHLLNEVYQGSNERLRGQTIRTTYFERDYVPGIATDKLPAERYTRPGYAVRLATLLGRVAASSIIVGRSLENARPAFDDGDEVVLEGNEGVPSDILVADHSGAFTEYTLPLERLAPDYARSVNIREAIVPKIVEFAEAYLAAFHDHFVEIQDEYRNRRRAFDNFFKQCKYDPAGSFAYRWECVLRRLDATNAEQLTEIIRRNIRVLNSNKA